MRGSMRWPATPPTASVALRQSDSWTDHLGSPVSAASCHSRVWPPLIQRLSRALPQRHHALLAPFAVQLDGLSVLRIDIATADADELRDAGTGVVEQQDQQAIPLPRPGLGVRCREDSFHLVT